MTKAETAETNERAGILQRIKSRIARAIQPSPVTVDVTTLMNEFQQSLVRMIPKKELQTMFAQVEAVPVKAGATVIRQGDEGDFFYMIAAGVATVTRKSKENNVPVILAELGKGECFGEEALISRGKRNATVVMQTDGIVLRLAKQHFLEILKEPLLTWLSPVEAQARVQQGAQWLDVRTAAEYRCSHLPGAISIPMTELRARCRDLDQNVTYICCCDNGRLAASAAFLMAQRGFQAAILRGGLQRLFKEG